MEKHKTVLMHILESDIISAYYYQAGVIEAALGYDRQLDEAIRLLKNLDEYKKILAPQNPKETSFVVPLKKQEPAPVAFVQQEKMVFSAIA